ncbi:MAG: DeoR/GlpR transcriptional regulator [Nitrospinae bacterium]|nr:DeoR/GlpR transcriptional regulator [Nitrospinota bacterium]
MADDRKDQLLKRIEEARKISLAQLSAEFEVSELTVRRDLKPMEESQLVKIGKGEVIYLPNDPLNGTLELDPGAGAVAEMAASLVSEKDRIIWIGGGDISLGIARRLENVTLVTNSLRTATAALKRKGLKVFLVGEEVDPESHCLYGKSLEMVREFTFNKAFVEADGYFNKRFLATGMAAETASLLSGNVLEKFIVIHGKNFGNVQTARLTGLREFKAVCTDTLKRSVLREVESIPLKVVYQSVEAEEHDEKIIPLRAKNN